MSGKNKTTKQSTTGPRRCAVYARVSSEGQADEMAVSIPEQLAEMRGLCERNGWAILAEFVDDKDYKATQQPKRGTIVNPSGERADRPQFLTMLEIVKAGEADFVLCWRDDRLVRHPRVASALEDALDLGDKARGNHTPILIYDATGAQLDRFVLHIKAVIGREDNKRRVERTKLGKTGTLKAGRWPGLFLTFGYKGIRDEDKRGKRIEIDKGEAKTVRRIYEWFDAGANLQEIRRRLIADNVSQKRPNLKTKKHEWSITILYNILRAECYTGRLAWTFGDGSEYAIEIPAIISRELWERSQTRLDDNKRLSTRNAGGVYLLQGLVYCGDCGAAMRVRQVKHYYENGERHERTTPNYMYLCPCPERYPDETHAKPYKWAGVKLDGDVWRYIVDNGIKHPELIREQIENRQAELQRQGDDVNGDIAHTRQRLVEISQERANYQKQNARGKMTDDEFDAHMDETEEAQRYWNSELSRLHDLRDNADKVKAGLDYATELLTGLQEELPTLDIPRKELLALPKEHQETVLRKRQRIVRALCDKVTIYADGRIVIDGLLDGSEAAQFELPTPSTCCTVRSLRLRRPPR